MERLFLWNESERFFLDSNDAHRLVFVMEWWRLVIHISDPTDVGSPLYS
jgi:hypothetical protein